MLTRMCVNVTIVQNGIETGNGLVSFTVVLAHLEASGALTPDDANNAAALAIAIMDTDGK